MAEKRIQPEREHPSRGPRRWRSDELFSGASRVVIQHNGDEYRLQVTRQGKLILTK